MRIRSGALALALVVAASGHARPARAQDTPTLPPPPPPSSPPQYTPPPTPPQTPGPTTAPPPPRRDPREPPRKEREKEREKEKEREREIVVRTRYVAPAPPPAPAHEGPPPAARWIQIGLRTGISIPAGGISGDPNDGMTHDFSLQVPFFAEVGVKVHRMIFLGAYGAFSVGGVSSQFANAQGCTGGARSCGSLDLRVGLEMQVHFRPEALLNPWAGYGLGFESAQASASGGGSPSTGESFSGFEFARLGGGIDVRVNRYFGLGPFAEIDFGTYTQEHVQGAQTSVDASLPNTALHEWFTLGVRGIIFP